MGVSDRIMEGNPRATYKPGNYLQDSNEDCEVPTVEPRATTRPIGAPHLNPQSQNLIRRCHWVAVDNKDEHKRLQQAVLNTFNDS